MPSLLAGGLALGLWAQLPTDDLARHSVGQLLPGDRLLETSEGLGELIGVVDQPGVGKFLMTNGHPMSGTPSVSQRYMRLFAHLPPLQVDRPTAAVVICFGVGNTAHATSLHPLDRIDLVDRSQHVLEHAGSFEEANHGVLKDPRLHVYVNDGREHLRMQPEGTYDLVTLEPPPLRHAGVASLYSQEFYRLAKSRLKEGGFLTQWLPIFQLPGDVALEVVHAFTEVFPGAVLLVGAGSELVLLGKKGPAMTLDPAQLERNLAARPAVRADLERVQLGSPLELVGTFAAGPQALEDAVAQTEPLSDDRPTMEYAVDTRLVPRHTPAALFDVRGVYEWCPGCRNDPELSLLEAYLGVTQTLHRTPGYLGDVLGGTQTIVSLPSNAGTDAVLAKSEYLRAQLRPQPR